jgi:intracellular septation protein A
MRPAGSGSVLELVLRHGPRFVRDACGPVFVFYAGWKIVGFHAGIAAATALAVVAYLWERRQARSGLSPAIGLGIALVQAVAGLMSARTLWYFAPSLIVNAACGVAFVVSVAVGQPLAAAFAAETSAFPSDVMASGLFRSVCSQISLVWAAYLLGGSLARLVVLLRSGVDLYLTVHFLTGFPLAAAIMGWSMWYGARRLRGASRSLT